MLFLFLELSCNGVMELNTFCDLNILDLSIPETSSMDLFET